VDHIQGGRHGRIIEAGNQLAIDTVYQVGILLTEVKGKDRSMPAGLNRVAKDEGEASHAIVTVGQFLGISFQFIPSGGRISDAGGFEHGLVIGQAHGIRIHRETIDFAVDGNEVEDLRVVDLIEALRLEDGGQVSRDAIGDHLGRVGKINLEEGRDLLASYQCSEGGGVIGVIGRRMVTLGYSFLKAVNRRLIVGCQSGLGSGGAPATVIATG